MNDFGTDFEDVATWAAAAHPARSRLRARARASRIEDYYHVPTRRDKVLAWVIVGAAATGLTLALVAGAAERRSEREAELREERAPISLPAPGRERQSSLDPPPATVHDAGLVPDVFYDDSPFWECEVMGNNDCGPETDETGGPE